QDVCGYLAAVQGPRREVPQRRLTLRGLVDGQHPTRVVLAALPEADQERVVRRPAEEALQLDAGEPEQVSLYRCRVKGLAGSHWRPGTGDRWGRRGGRSRDIEGVRRPPRPRPGARTRGAAPGWPRTAPLPGRPGRPLPRRL